MPGTRGDGKLYISFLQMGRGACIAISCPNGKFILIDCGGKPLDEKFSENQQDFLDQTIPRLYEDKFLGINTNIDALILTHSDTDHYNYLTRFLTGTISGGFGDVGLECSGITELYHSELMAKYKSNGTNGFFINDLIPDHTYAITMNDNKRSYTIAIGADKPGDSTPIPTSPINTEQVGMISAKTGTQGFYKVLDGSGGGKECGFYILASNVKAYPGINDNSTEANRGSVVSLLIHGNDRYLFCGDATFNTEKFLVDTYSPPASNFYPVKGVSVAHHGSSTTSSSWSGSDDLKIKGIAFIDKVNPQWAVFTAADETDRESKLPRRETVQRYIDFAPNLENDLNVEISVWEEKFEDRKVTIGTKKRTVRVSLGWFNTKIKPAKKLFSTGNLGTIDFEEA